jgi:hypothetical protein
MLHSAIVSSECHEVSLAICGLKESLDEQFHFFLLFLVYDLACNNTGVINNETFLLFRSFIVVLHHVRHTNCRLLSDGAVSILK